MKDHLVRWRASFTPAALVAILGVVALLAYVFMVGGYLVTVVGFAAIYGIFCIGLNFFMGYTGQASFGQNAFAAIGGYGTAILCVNWNWGPLAALLVTMALSGILALVIGYPTLRLRGHYLAMATLALGLITYDLAVNWTDLTSGYMGISGVPPLGVGSFALDSDRAQLAVLILVLLLGVWISHRLRHSRFGRALRAIAGSEAGASALGINIARYKLAAFVIAGLYASVAGSLFANFVGFISPEVFGLDMVVLTFTMLFLGGVGTVWGPVIGAVIIMLLLQVMQGLAQLQDIAYTAVLIAMLIFLPRGLSALGGIGWTGRRASAGEG